MKNNSDLPTTETGDPQKLQVIIYDTTNKPDRKLGVHPVTVTNSNHKTRWDVLSDFPNQWICFFDADCDVTASIVDRIQFKLLGQSRRTILCGRYTNELRSNSVQRAYNFICNTWLEAGLNFANPRLLGGFFVVYSSAEMRELDFSKIPKWGGEDLQFAQLVHSNNFSLQLLENIFVVHNPKSSLRHFIFRSFVQGKNRANDSHRNLNYWFAKLRQNSIKVQSIVLFHVVLVLFANFYSSIKMKTRLKTVAEKSVI